jgi:hypothetical protein
MLDRARQNTCWFHLSVGSSLVSAFLRSLISSPTSWHCPPPPVATCLLTHTLKLYTALGFYGLHAHTAMIAAEPLACLASHILSPECDSCSLLTALITLLGACASDPHQTAPPHETCRLGFVDGIMERGSWLEGVRQNGVHVGADGRGISLARG